MRIGQKLLYSLKKWCLSYLNRQIVQLQNRGQYQQALELANEVHDLTRRSLGEEHPSFITSLHNLGTIYQSLGKYIEAEQCLKKVVEIDRAERDAIFGLAMSLNNLACLYQAMGHYIKAKELFLESEQVLRNSLNELTQKKEDRWLTKVALPQLELFVAQNLNNLGLLYQTLGDYQQAKSYHQQALEIKRTNPGEKHPSFALSLNNLAMLHYETGNYSTAESLYQQSIKLLREKLGKSHPHFLNSLNNLALLYQELSNYAEAEKLLQQVLKTRQAVLGSNHPEVALSLRNLAGQYQIIGNYVEAEKLYQQANNIYRTTLGEERPEFSANLQNLANLYQIIGKYSSAESYYLQANDLLYKTLGENHWQVAQCLSNQALLYQVMGRYPEAELRYKQAEDILRRTLGENHPKVATTIGNLAALYQVMGDYVEAERLLLQANDIFFNVFGETHLSFVKNLNNLAHLYIEKGNYNEPELEHILNQTKEIQSEVLGEEHLDFAITLNNLGMLYKRKGNYTKAESFVKRSLEIRRKVLGENHSDFATCIGNLAALSQVNGEYSNAKLLWQQALKIKENTLGEYHPDVSRLLNNLAILYAAIGDEAQAFSLMEKAINIDNRTLKQVFSISSDRQRNKYLQILQVNFSGFLSLVSQHLSKSHEAIEAAFDLVLRRKALATEAAMIQRTAIFSRRYPQLDPQLEKMEEVANQITQLTFDVPSSPKQLATYQERLATLYRKQDELEKELSRLIPEMNLQKQLESADRHAVALALPAGATLVEFVRFNVYNFKAVPANGDSVWNDQAHYLAFILSANQPEQVKMIALGEAEPIDHLIQAFRYDISNGRGPDKGKIPDSNTEETSYRLELRRLVFDPLKPYLTEQLFISPDGELNCLPFGLLPTDEEEYLVQKYTISYLSTGRDLLRFFKEGKVKQDRLTKVQATEPLVLANPDYNLATEQESEEENISCPSSSQPSSSRNSATSQLVREIVAARDGEVFTPLPSTQIEGEKAAALLGVKVNTDVKALKSRVSKCQSPRILIIATHGYFLEDNQQPLSEIKIGQLIGYERLTWVAQQNQLVRSGLAFAGVNTMLAGGKLPEEAEDGLLTAQGVAGINLAATELVVTSACETALGDIHIGEGVAGLRRAFMLAGAQTLVMSFWKVDDVATAILMERFYRYLLQEKMGRAEALQKAQFDVRDLTIGEMRSEWLTPEAIASFKKQNEGVAKYLENLSKQPNNSYPYRHPQFWGAFICLGNPAPLSSS